MWPWATLTVHRSLMVCEHRAVHLGSSGGRGWVRTNDFCRVKTSPPCGAVRRHTHLITASPQLDGVASPCLLMPRGSCEVWVLAVWWHRWRGVSWSSTGAVLDWDHAGSAVAGGGIMKPFQLA
jgi:hypothetical protein